MPFLFTRRTLPTPAVTMLPSHPLPHHNGDLISLTLTIMADSSVSVSIMPLDLSHPSATLFSIPILTSTIPSAPPLHPLSHYFTPHHPYTAPQRTRPSLYHRPAPTVTSTASGGLSSAAAQSPFGVAGTTSVNSDSLVIEMSTVEMAGLEAEETKQQLDDLPFDVADILTRIDQLTPPDMQQHTTLTQTEHKEAPPLTTTGELHSVVIDVLSPDTTLSSTPSLSSLVLSNSPAAIPSPLAAASSSSAQLTRAMAWDAALLMTLYKHLVMRMLEYDQADDDWQMMEERRVALQRRIDDMRKQHPLPPAFSRSPSSSDLPPLSFALSADGLPSFPCPICLSECPSYAGVSLSGCAHFVCSSCLTDYLSASIMAGDVVVHCPCLDNNRPCRTNIPSTIILAYTPTPIYSHYVRMCALKRDNTLRNCPRCDHQQKGNRITSRLTCDKCQYQYCYHHSNAHPPTQSCRSYMRQQSAAHKESLRLIALTTIKCPSCSAPVEKESGCNHMQCTQCECEFCFLCGSRYACGLHFWEWNVLTGCPGMQHMPGVAGERRTITRRLWRSLCGWPLTLLLVPTILLLCVALFWVVEAVWLALFLLACPVLLVLRCCCGGWQSGWSWDARERFAWWLWLGPRLMMHVCPCNCCGDW